ncbi:MAG: hypothetical protein JO297_05100 [Nitrososphaeraceae archaeon]|nr:hypothetical protein [Nitrososphaeraceae archaeon]
MTSKRASYPFFTTSSDESLQSNSVYSSCVTQEADQHTGKPAIKDKLRCTLGKEVSKRPAQIDVIFIIV